MESSATIVTAPMLELGYQHAQFGHGVQKFEHATRHQQSWRVNLRTNS